ncbi:hypothetical protein NKG94_19825 [Micromonospora sp. M12]
MQPTEPEPGLRADLGLRDDDFVLMYAGNHGPAQRLGTVIDAVARLHDLPDVHLILVGDGVEKERCGRRRRAADPATSTSSTRFRRTAWRPGWPPPTCTSCPWRTIRCSASHCPARSSRSWPVANPCSPAHPATPPGSSARPVPVSTPDPRTRRTWPRSSDRPGRHHARGCGRWETRAATTT